MRLQREGGKEDGDGIYHKDHYVMSEILLFIDWLNETEYETKPEFSPHRLQ